MHPEAMCKSETVRRSLTDQILTLCMSGRFGVREAIAEAIKHQRARGKTAAPLGASAWAAPASRLSSPGEHPG